MTTGELIAALEAHYTPPNCDMPGGLFVPEVSPNGSWQNCGSRCDAVYVGFTTTSGRLMIGHELKISRSDWLHELASPGKADQWCDACHQWYVVASGPNIVGASELPEGWGLMLPGRRRRMIVQKADTKPKGFIPPWWASRSVMARADTLQADTRRTARNEFRQAVADEVRRQLQKRTAESDPVSTQAVLVLQAFNDAGIRLELDGHSPWGTDRQQYATPRELSRILPIVRDLRDAERIRRSLAKGWGCASDAVDSAQRLLEQARELCVAVDRLERGAVE